MVFAPGFPSGAVRAVSGLPRTADAGSVAPFVHSLEGVGGVLFCFCTSGRASARHPGDEAPGRSYKPQNPPVHGEWKMEMKPQDTPRADSGQEAGGSAGEGPEQEGTSASGDLSG